MYLLLYVFGYVLNTSEIQIHVNFMSLVLNSEGNKTIKNFIRSGTSVPKSF